VESIKKLSKRIILDKNELYQKYVGRNYHKLKLQNTLIVLLTPL